MIVHFGPALQILSPFVVVIPIVALSEALATWITYGFSPLRRLRGWSMGVPDLVYVMPPYWKFRGPVAIFWLGSERKNELALAKAMVRDRRLYRHKTKSIELFHTEAIHAKMERGMDTWPNRECAAAAGDPNGWYPELEKDPNP